MSESLNTFDKISYTPVIINVIDKEEQNRLIQSLIAPENELEENIVSDAEFKEGLFWGKPRYGHPEGAIINHIREVLDNVDRIPNLDDETRCKLRLVTLIHDTFKNKEQASRKIHGRQAHNHHAVYASAFADKHVKDNIVSNLIRYHDEAYYCWKLLRYEQNEAYQEKLSNLLNIIGEDIQIYYLFFKCDTQTGDKNQDSLKWFESTIQGISIVDF